MLRKHKNIEKFRVELEGQVEQIKRLGEIPGWSANLHKCEEYKVKTGEEWDPLSSALEVCFHELWDGCQRHKRQGKVQQEKEWNQKDESG